MKRRILVVDDHEEIIYAVRRVLASHDIEVVAAATVNQAMDVVDKVEAAIIDIRLEKECGIGLLGRLRKEGFELPVIILSAYASPDNIVSASKHGALEILRKPISSEELVAAVKQALAKSNLTPPVIDGVAHAPGIMGNSPQMVEVFKSLGLAATNDLSVLLTGETGVGKDVAARIIHEHSARADGPFVVLNSTAMPEALLEAELFGYAAGAFTGAVQSTPGHVESAAGGTLVLDEIGDMPLNCQAKVLRFLEDRSFHRLGESTERKVDVRVISATNQDLARQVEQSRFRLDLYYRLAQIPIHIPPLRDRPDDLQPLIEGFIGAVNEDLGLQLDGISELALAEARAHAWPGNVRELKNTVYRTAAKQKSGVLESLELMDHDGRDRSGLDSGGAHSLESIIDSAIRHEEIRSLMHRFEEQVLVQALSYFKGNKSRVAEVLDISRNTLRVRLKSYGIETDCDEHSSAAH